MEVLRGRHKTVFKSRLQMYIFFLFLLFRCKHSVFWPPNCEHDGTRCFSSLTKKGDPASWFLFAPTKKAWRTNPSYKESVPMQPAMQVLASGTLYMISFWLRLLHSSAVFARGASEAPAFCFESSHSKGGRQGLRQTTSESSAAHSHLPHPIFLYIWVLLTPQNQK